MESALYTFEYLSEIKEFVETTTLQWGIFDMNWLLDNQTNRKISTRDSDYPYTVEQERKYHLKIEFCGNNNLLVEIYYRVPVDMNVKVILQVSSRNEFADVIQKDYHWVKSKKWLLLTTLRKKDIVNNRLSNNKFYFKVYFKVNSNNANIPMKKQLLSHGPQMNDEEVDDTNIKSCIVDDMRKLFENLSFSDVTVLSIDGVEFKAHKAIMASRSSVLNAHFQHNTVESVSNVVKTNFEKEVLQEVLHYIYTDNVPRIADMPEKLLMAADFYQMDGLKSLCEEALSNKLSADNAIEILELAHLHQANRLMEQTLDFIRDDKSSAKEITKSKGWENLQSTELLKILYKNLTY